MAHFLFFAKLYIIYIYIYVNILYINCIYYFRWTAVLIAVAKAFRGETINVKYGNLVYVLDIKKEDFGEEGLALFFSLGSFQRAQLPNSVAH